MKIMYPNIIVWRQSLTDISDPYHIFSRNLASDIRRSFTKLKTLPYHFVIEKADKGYLDRFVPLYETFIRSKRHGFVHDVRGTVKDTAKKYFEAISFYKDNHYLGGLIYTVTPKSISTYYKIFPHRLTVNLRANVSFLAEYLLIKRALELKRFNLIHGADDNVFGLNSEIGLATFKIQAGNRPYVPNNLPVEFSHEFNFSGTNDVLIFLGDKKGAAITKVLLVITPSSQNYQQKYNILFKQSFFEVKVIEFSEK